VLAVLTFGIAHKIPLFESCQFSILCSQNVIQNFGTSPVSLINVLEQKIITTKQELENFKHFIPRAFKVILTVGSFDILDMGHLEYLRQAKEQGDLLLVALNSDVSLTKCGNRPNIPLDQKCGMLLSTKYVDFIVTFDDAPKWIIDIVKPNIFITGFGETDGQTKSNNK
jgi:cytidyltransferase-like protein